MGQAPPREGPRFGSLVSAVDEDGNEVVVHYFPEPGHEGIRGGVAGDARRVGQDLSPPDEACLLTEVDDVLEVVDEEPGPAAVPAGTG